MKIRQKIVITFLLIGVIPTFFVGLVNISNMRSLIEASGKNTIKSIAGFEVIAKLKADRLESMFGAIKGQAIMWQDSVALKDNFLIITKSFGDTTSLEYNKAKNALNVRIKNSLMETQSWISDIVLVDSSGKIIYAFDLEHFGKEIGGVLPDMAVFEKGKENISVGDVFMYKHKDGTNELLVPVSAPIKDADGSFLGEIVLLIKMNSIYDFIQDGTGLGETGEVFLGKKTGVEALVLNPLRFDSDAALKIKIEIGGSLDVPIQKAVSGENGSGNSIDYRGKEVLAAWRYLPSLGWGIVVKMDKQEVFSELNEFQNLNILILIILAFISVAIALYFARSISDPINNLVREVNDISRGKLDVKLEKLEGKDEIADLSRAFERTIVSLKLAMKEMTEKKQEPENKNQK